MEKYWNIYGGRKAKVTGIKERQDAEEDELLAGEDFHPNDSSHCLKSSDFDFDRLDRIDFQES